ncbi:MAG TPA: hypothetical protein VEU33_14950 [Archangium sp.]|nr:hypothetical protein [Archangium sp.]
MQAMKLLTIACVLFSGMAFGHDNAVRDMIEERLIRSSIHERGFEQLLASHVAHADRLPPSGILEGAYLPLLSDALEPRTVFKLGTWVLCVAPKAAEEGTVLLVDSIQTRPRDQGPSTVEVLYRQVKASGQHTTGQVWPYAVLFVRGWHDKAVCRPANG